MQYKNILRFIVIFSKCGRTLNKVQMLPRSEPMKGGLPITEPHSFILDLVEENPMAGSPLATRSSDIKQAKVNPLAT